MTEKSRAILVVVPEASAVSLGETLKATGYPIFFSNDPASAAQTLREHPEIGLVLSEARAPGFDGIGLAKVLKAQCDSPVVLLVDASQLDQLTDKDLIDQFLIKPVSPEDLQEITKAYLISGAASKESKDSELDFCKISISDFLAGKDIAYDIFIRLSETKFVKIAYKGEDLTLERIRNYQNKDTRFLYLRKADFAKYVGFSVAISGALKPEMKLSTPKKLNILKHTGEILTQYLRHRDLNDEVFEKTKAFIESSLSVLSEELDLLELLEILRAHSDFIYAHSVAVAFYGVMLARELKWNASSTLFKVALAGFLHDIGKKELAPSTIGKAKSALTQEEEKLLASHPARGAEILGTIKKIPTEVILVAQQHHELCNGKGYPSHLYKDGIYPLARLIALANEFANLILEGPETPHPGLSPAQAIDRLSKADPHTYDADFFVALQRLFT